MLEKQISFLCRTTLIKSITFFIPVYTMQTVELPKAICDSIDKCNPGFWWGDTKQKKRVHHVE